VVAFGPGTPKFPVLNPPTPKVLQGTLGSEKSPIISRYYIVGDITSNCIVFQWAKGVFPRILTGSVFMSAYGLDQSWTMFLF
jgi:hypothetical protein